MCFSARLGMPLRTRSCYISYFVVGIQFKSGKIYARLTLADPMPRLASDAPIGLRCRQRQIGTKPSGVASGTPFTLAEWRAMRTFVSVGAVKESYLLQLPLKELHCHVRLPISRCPPYGLPMMPRQLMSG